VGFGAAIVGYYQVPFSVASVVGYSSAFAFSLYPSLLKGGGERLTAVTIESALLFALPLATGGVVLAGPILGFFGKAYSVGELGLTILALVSLVTTVSIIVDQALLGRERVDEAGATSAGSLLRSNLVFVPVVNIAWEVVYLVGLLFALSYAATMGYSAGDSVAIWGMAQLVASSAFLGVKVRRARHYTKLRPGRGTVWHLVASIVMGLALYIVAPLVPLPLGGTLVYGLLLLGLVVLGGVIYFGLVFALDREFRDTALRLLRRISS